MDWRVAAEVLIGLLVAASGVPYLVDTIAGRTKPQRASWAVFAALAAAATVTQVDEHGVTGGSVMTAVSAVQFSVIAALAVRHGVGGTSVIDRLVLAGLCAVVATWVTIGNHPMILPLLIAVEIPAIAVTMAKVVRMPGTETCAMWLVESVASVLAVVAAPGVDSSVVFPTYNATVNLAVVAAIWWVRPGRLRIVLARPTTLPLHLQFDRPDDRLVWLTPARPSPEMRSHDAMTLSDAAALADAMAVAGAAAQLRA